MRERGDSWPGTPSAPVEERRGGVEERERERVERGRKGERGETERDERELALTMFALARRV